MKVQYASEINVKLQNSFKLATVFDSNFTNSFGLNFFVLLQNPVPYVIHMESVPGRLHCFQRVIREQCLLSCPRYAPTLNSGEARRAALVACFAAGSALAVRRSSLPNKQQPIASQCPRCGAQ